MSNKVQDTAKIIIERQQEVIHDLLNGVISCDLQVSRSQTFSKAVISQEARLSLG